MRTFLFTSCALCATIYHVTHMKRNTITPEWIHLRSFHPPITRRHVLVEFTETTTISLHINMSKQPVIVVKTEQGHEVISETLRCVCRAQSEYEAHLFLHKYAGNYRVVNTTSKVGAHILERAQSRGIVQAVAL